MSLKEKFDLAVEVANKLPRASNEDMLELYGWFKQANIGDVNTGASPSPPPRFLPPTQPDLHRSPR
jgi:acyl-CoA-binding protein